MVLTRRWRWKPSIYRFPTFSCKLNRNYRNQKQDGSRPSITILHAIAIIIHISSPCAASLIRFIPRLNRLLTRIIPLISPHFPPSLHDRFIVHDLDQFWIQQASSAQVVFASEKAWEVWLTRVSETGNMGIARYTLLEIGIRIPDFLERVFLECFTDLWPRDVLFRLIIQVFESKWSHQEWTSSREWTKKIPCKDLQRPSDMIIFA